MSSYRTLWVLGALALGVFGFVLWEQLAPRELRPDGPSSQRLLGDCGVPVRVQWLRPEAPPVTLRPGSEYSYVLCVGASCERDIGQATDIPADAEMVRDVLGTLELLSARRSLSASREQRGLAPPRLRLLVNCAGGGQAELLMGARLLEDDEDGDDGDDGADGDGRASLERAWVARGDAADDDTDYLIDAHDAEVLDLRVDELRRRRVFSGLADGTGAAEARIALERGERSIAVTLTPPRLEIPGEDGFAQADAERLAALVEQVAALRIAVFSDLEIPLPAASAPAAPEKPSAADADAAPSPSSASDAGVALVASDADAGVALAASDADAGMSDAGAAPGEDAGQTGGDDAEVEGTADGAASAGAPLLSLRVESKTRTAMLEELGPCPAAIAPADITARLVRTHIGTGCIAADALAALDGFFDPASLISRRVVPAGEAWASIRMELPYGLSLLFQAEASGLSMFVDYGAHGDEEREAETAALRDWLAGIDAAVGLDPPDPAGAAQDALLVSPEALPRDPVPVVSLVFQAPGAGAREIYVGLFRDPRPAAVQRYLARRGMEPVYLTLGKSPHIDGIEPVEPLRFVPRTLLVREPYALREVIARRGKRVDEHLLRGELLDDWSMPVPPGAKPSGERIERLRQSLAQMRASRMVAEVPAPEHGLSAPRREIEAVFDPGPLDADAPPEHYWLRIGAPSADGCFARLDNRGPVFELSAESCELLLGSWQSR
ncbi:hypothetical protein, partial [Haliangium ochraceum]|uniref:Uncharacterized protein n=1 Tax=Haliangium ochraceum (strain DSM 14365 / JCM 11303 / SMP-2) TaxID=502025 RepID=D0LGA7_HALO1